MFFHRLTPLSWLEKVDTIFRPTVHVPLFRKGIRLATSPFKSENPEGVEIEIVLTIYLFF